MAIQLREPCFAVLNLPDLLIEVGDCLFNNFVFVELFTFFLRLELSLAEVNQVANAIHHLLLDYVTLLNDNLISEGRSHLLILRTGWDLSRVVAKEIQVGLDLEELLILVDGHVPSLIGIDEVFNHLDGLIHLGHPAECLRFELDVHNLCQLVDLVNLSLSVGNQSEIFNVFKTHIVMLTQFVLQLFDEIFNLLLDSGLFMAEESLLLVNELKTLDTLERLS